MYIVAPRSQATHEQGVAVAPPWGKVPNKAACGVNPPCSASRAKLERATEWEGIGAKRARQKEAGVSSVALLASAKPNRITEATLPGRFAHVVHTENRRERNIKRTVLPWCNDRGELILELMGNQIACGGLSRDCAALTSKRPSSLCPV